MGMNEGKGHYLGTEIDEKWWQRYSSDGFLARGNGEYWTDTSAFHFRRHLTETPIVIPFRDVILVKTGKWHSGRWLYGFPVVKIVWSKAGTRLSSGFFFSRNASEVETLVAKIRKLVEAQAASSAAPLPNRLTYPQN